MRSDVLCCRRAGLLFFMASEPRKTIRSLKAPFHWPLLWRPCAGPVGPTSAAEGSETAVAPVDPAPGVSPTDHRPASSRRRPKSHPGFTSHGAAALSKFLWSFCSVSSRREGHIYNVDVLTLRRPSCAGCSRARGLFVYTTSPGRPYRQ